MTSNDRPDPSGSDVPENGSPQGAGAESSDEGDAAMKDADDAVIDEPAGGSNSAD